MRRTILSTLVAAACFSASATVSAESKPEFRDEATDFTAIKRATGKLDGLLQQVQRQTASQGHRLKGATVGNAGNGQLQAMTIPLVGGEKVVIDAVANGDAAGLLAELNSMGLTNGTAYGNVVSGLFPVASLDALNSVPGLNHARAGLHSANVGSVTTRGDIAQASDVARSQFGVTGAGLNVGTLSDSYDCLGGAAADVASGDLPAGVNVLQEGPCPASDEGRGMMQFIHDVAPGAEQSFFSAFFGQAGFAAGIEALSATGSDVIVDDIIYFAEPMFADGVIAQAVDNVVANGSAYFSSAGNNARDAFEDGFRPSGVLGVFGGERHDFDPGPGVDDLQQVTLGTGTTIFAFNWSEPYASVSGAPGSSSDLDIVLYLSGGIFIGLGGFSFNIGGDPIEVFGVSNSGPPIAVDIGIELFSGPTPAKMKYVYFDQGPTTVDDFATNSGSSYGHANAAGAASIGAAAWFNTAAFNPNPACDPACLNGFSSAGPTEILFDLNGNPVLEIRQNPSVVGPDGGNTTFFGSDLSFPVPGTNEPDGFPNFFGTSASAPHVAAIAALMLETDASLSPTDVYGLIEGTATDMDDPATPGFDTGVDFGTGAGFVNADLAVEAAGTDPNKPHKRLVCHKGKKTLSIGASAVPAHLGHGDKFGPCN